MSEVVTRLNAVLEGRYRVDGELGEGGMATVYLASDVRHSRKVALKVLKPELAAVVGAERFLTEIETTANLQHPHILPLFDSGEADGFLFYVMPYVEGETLRDRLKREHQLPVDDALRIATDVAGALEYAHRNGVIHRDIKPANILLQDGRPMIADFGIALAVGAAGGGRLTETGLSLGTPHYMSPEQATGDLTVGAGADVYALGCVVYEILVGEPPYTGSTAQAILGKIITGKAPSATEHRRSVPAHVDAAIRKALEKVPADRFAGARDFANALGDAGFRHGVGVASGAGHSSSPWNRLTVALAATTAVLAVLASWSLYGRAPSSPNETAVTRFGIPVLQGIELDSGSYVPHFERTTMTAVAFSPDGNQIAYVAQPPATGNQLYIHRLDGERADRIEVAGQSFMPFFSPGGEWLGFVNRSVDGSMSLRRFSVADRTIETIAELPPGLAPPGATWADDGTIVVSDYDALLRVPATGGAWEDLVTRDSLSADRFFQPHMLPGSKTLLFHVAGSHDPEHSDIVAMDLDTRVRTPVLTNAQDPRYLPTGHLLFMRQATLMAVGFDVERVGVTGEPVIIEENVMTPLHGPSSGWQTGAGQVAVSAAGHLAFARGGVYPEVPQRAVRTTGAADIVDLEMEPRGYVHHRVSPNGTRIASSVGHGMKTELWVHDLARGTNQRLSTPGYSNAPMAWSPDGESLAFSSDADGQWRDIYRMRADNSEEPELLVPPGGAPRTVMSWSSQGDLAWLEGGDIWVMPPGGDPRPFVTSPEFFSGWATFSPNGDWMAYTTDQSGRLEVYVRPYPGPGPAVQVSRAGGRSSTWSSDGRRIFFLTLDPRNQAMMVANVVPGDPFVAARPEVLIEPFRDGIVPVNGYDVFPDGSFVTLRRAEEADDLRAHRDRPGELRVILNFFDLVRARVRN